MKKDFPFKSSSVSNSLQSIKLSTNVLTVPCISDISVKSDLKFYFMGICKDINTNFCHL